MDIAIVTGASSGLGHEFVRKIDEIGGLDEIWVVARRADRLEALAAECKTTVVPLALDLLEQQSFESIESRLEQSGANVKLLVNNAGIGKVGSYADIPAADNAAAIDLNCRALVAMSVLALPHMREGARILQLCSSSSFQPLPYLGVYAATKAFVLRYSRALRSELKPRKIGSTAVCPYWISDTEFIPLAKQAPGEGAAVKRFPLSTKADFVVRRALKGTAKNRAVVTPGFMATLQRVSSKLPHAWVMATWEWLRKV